MEDFDENKVLKKALELALRALADAFYKRNMPGFVETMPEIWILRAKKALEQEKALDTLFPHAELH